MTAPRFKLAADDLRARLDAAPSVVVAGYTVVRVGSDLVEVRDVRTSTGRE